MDTQNLPNVNFNVDYNTILPIQQKRTIAFLNNFITNTVSFLNTFAQSCESRLLEFEYKVQKVEANLLILESQLSSIPGIDVKEPEENSNRVEQNSTTSLELPTIVQDATEVNETVSNDSSQGTIASQDIRFIKFFKMLQVGVPAQAVKNKMLVEGVDPTILDRPNDVVSEDGSDNASP